MTSEQRSEKSKEVKHVKIQGSGFQAEENSQHKDPTQPRNSEESRGAAVQWAKGGGDRETVSGEQMIKLRTYVDSTA